LDEREPRIAVVVLTWNGRENTMACLASLERTEGCSLDVIVTDNGSTDGTVPAVRAAHPAVTVIENGRNLGFAGGNNVGIELALQRGAEAVLVLNNDTTVEPQTIATLHRALTAADDVGACSPVLTYASQRDRLWFAGSRYDPARGHSGRASAYEQGAPLPAAAVPIDRAVGAAMLVRRACIAEVGAFAEEFFFLYEDVDWSLRMRSAGWRILLVPDARVAHRVSASQGGEPMTPTTAYYGTRNDLELGRRHASLTGARAAARQALCLLVHLWQLRRAPAGTRLATTRATFEGARDFARGALFQRGAPRPSG